VRVLQVTSSFPRRKGDVSGVFIADIAATIAAEEGVEVHVIAPHDAGALRDEVIDGVHVHRFRYAWPARLEVLAHRGGILAALRYPSRMLLVPPFLACYLISTVRRTKELRPDVLHAHWWFPGGVIAAIASILTKTPLVITLHGSDVHIAERPGLRKLARLTLRRATVVGVVSEALRREALDLAKEGIQVSRFKGLGVLLEAMQELDEAELDVFGDGPARAELEAAATGLGDRVRFHGNRPRAEFAETLARAHALVVPSLREGLGMVALEALAVGRPVIASGVGGLVETVVDGDDGILVPPGDPVALAAALRRLPLPPPKAAAVARHRTDAVARAHVEAYERTRT